MTFLPGPTIIAAILAAVLAAAMYFAGHHVGTTQAELAHSEAARQTEQRVNETQQRDAAELARLHEQLHIQTEELANEAEADPDADNIVLDAESVHRINEVGAGPDPAGR